MSTRLASLPVAALLAAPVATQAQTTINFEGTGAPCLFRETAPLTTLYAAQGVTFSGGGAILNQCGNFGLFGARSGTDFLAFSVNNSDYATGPEVLTFASLAGSVSIFAATRDVGSVFTLDAFDATGLLLGTTSIAAAANTFTELALSRSGVRSVRLTSTARSYVYDDLSFTSTSSVVPEPGTWTLVGAGVLAVGGVATRRRRAAA